MQFACLSIDFNHVKFQPRSVSHSGKTSPPCGDHERSIGEIFLSCVKRTKLKLLQQALLPCVQNLLYGFRRAMILIEFTAVLHSSV